MIIDCHSHLASRATLPDAFFDGWAETVARSLPAEPSPQQRRRLAELFGQMREDPDCRALLAEMDAAGIDKSVLLIIDFGLSFEDLGWDIEAVHQRHRRLIAQNGRLAAFSGVDPRRGASGLRLFEKAVTQWGFSGLKVYPPCGFSPSDQSLFPYYEICSGLGLPVLVHVGPSSSRMAFRFSQPMELDRAAQSFPGVNFILGHAGTVLYQEAGLLAQYRPNIYLDMSGFQQELRRGGLAGIIRWHLSKNLGRRLLFGTDWPIHRFFGTQSDWVQSFLRLESEGVFNPQELEDLFCNNIMRILPAPKALSLSPP